MVGLTEKLLSPGCFGVGFRTVSWGARSELVPTLDALGAAFARLFLPGDPAVLSGSSFSVGVLGLGAYIGVGPVAGGVGRMSG